MTNAIEIKDLTYSYAADWSPKKVPALKNITLNIAEGETFGFLGPNGAGKTSTIKCILGLVKPSSGSIKILGLDSRNVKAREHVGYLPEQPYFYDHLSVNELVSFYAVLAGIKNNIAEKVDRALTRTGVADRKNFKMRALSKGLTQRVAMAQAIVANPKILILDEPFSGLDPIGRKELRDLIFELKSEGTTIFMSSHILSDVEFLCERASITVKGELKGVFNLKDLASSASKNFEIVVSNANSASEKLKQNCSSFTDNKKLLRLNFDNKDKAESALKLILDSKIDLESFTTSHSNLEEIFIKTVEAK